MLLCSPVPSFRRITQKVALHTSLIIALHYISVLYSEAIVQLLQLELISTYLKSAW